MVSGKQDDKITVEKTDNNSEGNFSQCTTSISDKIGSHYKYCCNNHAWHGDVYGNWVEEYRHYSPFFFAWVDRTGFF